MLFCLVPYLNNLSTVALNISHFRQFKHYCGIKNRRIRCYKRIKLLKTFLMPSIKHVWFTDLLNFPVQIGSFRFRFVLRSDMELNAL